MGWDRPPCFSRWTDVATFAQSRAQCGSRQHFPRPVLRCQLKATRLYSAYIHTSLADLQQVRLSHERWRRTGRVKGLDEHGTEPGKGFKTPSPTGTRRQNPNSSSETFSPPEALIKDLGGRRGKSMNGFSYAEVERHVASDLGRGPRTRLLTALALESRRSSRLGRRRVWRITRGVPSGRTLDGCTPQVSSQFPFPPCTESVDPRLGLARRGWRWQEANQGGEGWE